MKSYHKFLLIPWIGLILSLACSSSSLLPGDPVVVNPADGEIPSATIPPAPPSDPTPTLDRTSFASTGLIAFTRFSESSVDLYTYNAETGEQRRLTNLPGASLHPRWSPDGRFLSYLYLDSETDRVDIWVLDILAGPPGRPVTQAGIGGFPDIAWSPNNQHLLYWSNPKDDPAATVILRLDVTTGFLESLTPDYTQWNSYPAWSPDGAHIAFVSNRPGDENSTDDIWLMDSNGGSKFRLVSANEPGWQESKPAWAPDNWRIAFFRYPAPNADIDSQTLQPGLWVISRDGTNEKLLFGFPGSDFSESPVWSPDGNWIAFTAGELDQTDVWLLPSSGGQAINISLLPGEESRIAWSPDSAWLLFTNTYEGGTFLYIVDIDVSGARQLLPGEGSGYADWGP